jgi:fido (protein-threonine AMPylation protein)
VYPFARQLRYVDIAKPGQSGEPFLHHRWIETHTSAVTDQLSAQNNFTGLRDPGQWADRAGYFYAALRHAQPFREGNGRCMPATWTGLTHPGVTRVEIDHTGARADRSDVLAVPTTTAVHRLRAHSNPRRQSALNGGASAYRSRGMDHR